MTTSPLIRQRQNSPLFAIFFVRWQCTKFNIFVRYATPLRTGVWDWSNRWINANYGGESDRENGRRSKEGNGRQKEGRKKRKGKVAAGVLQTRLRLLMLANNARKLNSECVTPAAAVVHRRLKASATVVSFFLFNRAISRQRSGLAWCHSKESWSIADRVAGSILGLPFITIYIELFPTTCTHTRRLTAPVRLQLSASLHYSRQCCLNYTSGSLGLHLPWRLLLSIGCRTSWLTDMTDY